MDEDSLSAGKAAEPPVGVDREAFTLAYLAAHEAECPACGYNVHRLTRARCPECGRPLEVRVVAAVGGYSAAWIFLMAAAAFAGGVGVLMCVLVARFGSPYGFKVAIPITYFIGNIPLPFLALSFRKRLVRVSRPIQWALAAVIGGAAVFEAVHFFWVL
jgi:hypothetical protein